MVPDGSIGAWQAIVTELCNKVAVRDVVLRRLNAALDSWDCNAVEMNSLEGERFVAALRFARSFADPEGEK
jgi:hypothetical protein